MKFETEPRIAVVGLGYVVLPVAVAFAERYAGTVGFDIDPSKIEALHNGQDPNREVDPGRLQDSGLTVSDDPSMLVDANTYVVTVPTPIDQDRRPELRPLLSACDTIGPHLASGDLVIFESTVWPGLTAEVCGPALERASGLTASQDFWLGYSPERINPGDTEHTLERIVKVVSGDTPETLERVATLYEPIIHAGLHRAPSIEVAEAAKVIENTQRDLNIALMNELAIIFDRIGISTRDVLEAARKVLASGKTNYWTGHEARSFERDYAWHLGRNFAVALHNGTQALELALVTLGVGEGDEVITTSRTFIASASAAVMRGATPVLVDVDRDSGNLTAETVAPHLTERTKAIVAVHLGGWPVEMEPLLDLARAHDVAVIEDAAQAHGATLHGRPAGSFGELAAFSFCQDKIITTGGEGGLLTMDDELRWRSAWAFKDHGKSYEAIYEQPSNGNGYKPVYDSFGTNWRMPEVQAAIGRIQLAKLPGWSERRRAIGRRYEGALRPLAGLRIPIVPEYAQHAYYRSYLYVRPDALKTGFRTRILDEVAASGVPCFVGSASELYREKAFREAGFGPGERFQVAKELGDTALALLCHPTLSDDAVERKIEAVSDVVQRATR